MGKYSKLLFLSDVEVDYVKKQLLQDDQPKAVPAESNLQKEGKTIIDEESDI